MRRGLLRPVHRGVYAWAASDWGPWGSWMAAVLACGPGAMLSHRSAARRLGHLAVRPQAHRSESGRRRSDAPRRDPAPPGTAAARRSGGDRWRPGDLRLPHALRPGRRSSPNAAGRAGVQRGGSAAADEPRLAAAAAEAPSGPPGHRGGAGPAGLRGAGRDQPERSRGAVRRARRQARPAAAAPQRDAAVARDASSRSTASGRRPRLLVELDGRAVHGTRHAFEATASATGSCSPRAGGSLRVTWRQLQRRTAGAIAADLRELLREDDTWLLPCRRWSRELFEHYLRRRDAGVGRRSTRRLHRRRRRRRLRRSLAGSRW